MKKMENRLVVVRVQKWLGVSAIKMEFSDPLTWVVFPFIYILFNFIEQCFIISSV